jgi:hypothetical protein
MRLGTQLWQSAHWLNWHRDEREMSDYSIVFMPEAEGVESCLELEIQI